MVYLPHSQRNATQMVEEQCAYSSSACSSESSSAGGVAAFPLSLSFARNGISLSLADAPLSLSLRAAA